jgi:hypothetical protein
MNELRTLMSDAGRGKEILNLPYLSLSTVRETAEET